jgi:hypothetical protein
MHTALPLPVLHLDLAPAGSSGPPGRAPAREPNQFSGFTCSCRSCGQGKAGGR